MRTDLPTSNKVELAATTVALQGEYGAITSLEDRFDVSRPTVYAAGETATKILERHFGDELTDGVYVLVDGAQLQRAIVALRVMSPNAFRPIEDMLPILCPPIRPPSFGTIQGIAAKAEQNSAIFNEKADLSRIHVGALDEMFSQGDLVLAGIDLETGFLYSLSLETSRGGKDWEKTLLQGKTQGLALEIVIKDAAKGIAGTDQTALHFEPRQSTLVPREPASAGCGGV